MATLCSMPGCRPTHCSLCEVTNKTCSLCSFRSPDIPSCHRSGAASSLEPHSQGSSLSQGSLSYHVFGPTSLEQHCPWSEARFFCFTGFLSVPGSLASGVPPSPLQQWSTLMLGVSQCFLFHRVPFCSRQRFSSPAKMTSRC